MDGVLVDYQGGYKKWNSGKTLKETVDSEGAAAARKRYLEWGIAFWSSLEWLHGGQELWNASKALFETVCILSSTGTTDTTKAEPAQIGKRNWIQKNMPDMKMDNVFIVNGRHMKAEKAAPNAILVDDVGETIEAWDKAGGTGILHNHRRYRDTIEDLEDIARPMSLMEIVKRFKH